MSLKLMYITNQPEIAIIAETAGVDQIFIDMEFVGKKNRQGGMNTVQSHHTMEDIRAIRKVLHHATIMVRINPIHEAGSEGELEYCDSKQEINEAIIAGADILMLPYFKTLEEIQKFVEYVDGRVRTFLLVETVEAASLIKEIVKIPGVDQIHVGLNDLSLEKKSGFMFGLLTDGTVEEIADICNAAGMPFGFGGVASLGKGLLPAEYILGEHYRLGSQFVILSRSFCDVAKLDNLDEVKEIFVNGIKEIRELEFELQKRKEAKDEAFFADNMKEIENGVAKVQAILNAKNGV